jgi:hypothetical protein
VPKPRVNLTRFHGVFAPNSKHRALVTPAKQGKGNRPKAADGQGEHAPVRRHAAMSWAQRLKRVFNIDVETCRVCGGPAKVIACIEDPVVIKKILRHLEEKLLTRAALLLPDSRAPRSPAYSADSRKHSRSTNVNVAALRRCNRVSVGLEA